MVNVSRKGETLRHARASATVEMNQPARTALQNSREDGSSKGDCLAAARLAGIMAAKRTAELIPLCHPVQLCCVVVHLEATPYGVNVIAEVESYGRTGVEMEALTAVSVASLALYDMLKAVDKGMRIVQVQLEEKQGGTSGKWQRSPPTVGAQSNT